MQAAGLLATSPKSAVRLHKAEMDGHFFRAASDADSSDPKILPLMVAGRAGRSAALQFSVGDLRMESTINTGTAAFRESSFSPTARRPAWSEASSTLSSD